MKKTKEEQLALAGTEEGEILARLSERVERAIATINDLRRERDALKTRLDEAESRLRDHDEAGERLSSLEEEHERFTRERNEIRNRIEGILSSLEVLDE
ncbi:MAG TPA: cell division protein ZapB [Thermoanaerobaculia bacterium]